MLNYIFRPRTFSDPMSDSNIRSNERPTTLRFRQVLPAWLSSMVLHAILLVVLVVIVRSVPQGLVEEPARTTGIVLKHTSNAGEYYEGENSNLEVASDSARPADASTLTAALPGENDSPLDASTVLPDARVGAGPPSGAISGGGNVRLDGAGVGERNIEGGKARTGIFGITGEGYKFVYVFDQSDSMAAYQGRPLAAAKRELIGSLQSLGKTNQFQIIFYNEFEKIFNPTMPGRLFFATEENKRAADKFISRVKASGATRHLEPLLTAVEMGPDVIFFLTDGTFPKLSSQDLRQIERRNEGRAAINVIQFGTTQSGSDNWLKRLARKNRGEYVFFNLRRLSPQGDAP